MASRRLEGRRSLGAVDGVGAVDGGQLGGGLVPHPAQLGLDQPRPAGQLDGAEAQALGERRQVVGRDVTRGGGGGSRAGSCAATDMAR